MIVVLVYLAVDGCCDVLVPLRLNGFVCHGGCNSLVDRCVVVAGFGHEVRNGLAGFVHDEYLLKCFGVEDMKGEEVGSREARCRGKWLIVKYLRSKELDSG